MPEPLQIKGFREYRQAVERTGIALPGAMKDALNSVAYGIVFRAEPKIRSKSGNAYDSMRVASTSTGGRIKAGGRRAGYYPWIDFGGKRTRTFNGRTFTDRVGRPFDPDGRVLYRTYYDDRDAGRIQSEMRQAFVEVARRAGLIVEVT